LDNNSNNIDQDLNQAYQNAIYKLNQYDINIRPNNYNEELDLILAQTQGAVSSWAFITACNPGSVVLPESINNTRTKQLLEDIVHSGFRHLKGWSGSPSDDWPREDSLLILTIKIEEAKQLAQHYGQNAFLFGLQHQKAKLIWV